MARKNGAKRALLIAEDAEDAVNKKTMLKENGFDVTRCSTPQKAMKTAADNTFDAVLYIMRPSAEFVDTLDYLRERLPKSRIVVYAKRAFLGPYETQIKAAGAIPLMFFTPGGKIAAALRGE